MNAIAVALSLSVAANAVLGWAWLDAREELVVAARDRDTARGDASACSDATDDLRDLADKRGKEAKVAQAAARRTALAHEQLALQILGTPAAVPGDDCGSARVRADAWLRERKAP